MIKQKAHLANDLKKVLLAGILVFLLAVKGNSQSADENIELYKVISNKIITGLKEANFDTKNTVLLFSIRFNLDSLGNVRNFETSRFCTPAICKYLRLYLVGQPGIELKYSSNLKELKDKYITVPIVITPNIDTANLSKNFGASKISFSEASINIDMIRDLYNFTPADSKKQYYFWYPPFQGLIFTPVCYPYTYLSPYGSKFEKYYKKNNF